MGFLIANNCSPVSEPNPKFAPGIAPVSAVSRLRFARPYLRQSLRPLLWFRVWLGSATSRLRFMFGLRLRFRVCARFVVFLLAVRVGGFASRCFLWGAWCCAPKFFLLDKSNKKIKKRKRV